MNLSKLLPQRLGKKPFRLKQAPQPCEYFCVQQNSIFLMLLTSPAVVIALKCHEGILNTNSKQLFRLVTSPFFFFFLIPFIQRLRPENREQIIKSEKRNLRVSLDW